MARVINFFFELTLRKSKDRPETSMSTQKHRYTSTSNEGVHDRWKNLHNQSYLNEPNFGTRLTIPSSKRLGIIQHQSAKQLRKVY